MSAATYDITIEQGATFLREFNWKRDTGSGYLPVDLTGYSARMQVRAKVSASTILYEATTTNGKLVLDPLAGKITLSIGPDESAAWKWRSGVYDLELQLGSVVTRLLQGTVTVSPEVTR